MTDDDRVILWPGADSSDSPFWPPSVNVEQVTTPENYTPAGHGFGKLRPYATVVANWPVFLALAVLIYWWWSE